MKFYDEKTFDGATQGKSTVVDDKPHNQSAGWFERSFTALLRRMLDGNEGTLHLQLPNGHRYTFGSQAPFASVHLNNYQCLRRLLTSGTNGWSESYLAGDWDSPDLGELVQWALNYEQKLTSLSYLSFWSDLKHNRFHKSRDNNKAGSRRNIAEHYDLGNDFYRLWLDQTMTYSSALYTHDGMTLEQAQIAKYQRILALLKPEVDSNILEIGCGWGGFAETAARQQQKVHGVTLSARQLEWAEQRISNAELTDRATFSLTDYRDITSQYDNIVSIEMFEAVGESHWDTYFQQLKRCLKPDGTAVLQIITIDDDRFETYRKQADFIQRYIFPGGMLPSVAILKEKFEQHGLELVEQQMFGLDYARTLNEWASAFETNFTDIEKQGFDQHFYRLWRYYLAYCEGGFRSKAIDVGFFALKVKN